MKLMVRTDMEGASGIVSYCQAEVGAAEYAEGRRFFLSDLRALLRGLNAGSGTEVVIYDEHFYGRNIPPDEVPRGVNVYCGKPPYTAGWAGGLDSGFDGLVLLGFHSKAGTPGALLPHSYELTNRDIRVDGLSVGEIGLEAMIAGELGVPALLMVGDDAGCREAKALMPGIPCVETKKGFCETGGCIRPLQDTAAEITEAARKLLAGTSPVVKPLVPGKNPTLEIDLAEGSFCDMTAKLYPGSYKDGTVTLKAPTLCGAWGEFWRMKLAAQAALQG
ncbi:MAG: M55 family metallopeptidase [Oscillospiraceae bacterium]|jgi:D-amino peptidase|nr:M55 family metallopeptidase [Oscillospiraceae bacterium]